MNTKLFWLSIIAVIISFIGGFALANALNRSELEKLTAENERVKSAQTVAAGNKSELTLSDGEIRQKIAEADENPTNIAFQKNLGLALYRYAAMKQDSDLLAEVARVLNRVYVADAQDKDIQIALGNIYFDIGYIKKDNENFVKARKFYETALQQKPDDVDVRTDLGLTYFLLNPPETDRAIAEFQKSLKINPKHEKTLQVLTQTLLSENKTDEAGKYLTRLKEINPQNQYLPELEAQFAQSRNE